MEPNTLLLVARTQSLAKRLRTALDAERYVVRWVPSTAQALKLGLHPLLLILDVPASGGARSVVWLKQRFDVPLLALLRAGQSPPSGIDGSLSRPHSLEKLVDLIETTLIYHSPHMIRAAGVCLDRKTRRLQINGGLVQLRPIGCRILALLMARAGTVVPRDELFRLAWQTDDGDGSRALDVHIAGLRRQLEADPRHPRLIRTERGIGYWFQPPA
jgi:DNA-binding response OmpR family regulator